MNSVKKIKNTFLTYSFFNLFFSRHTSLLHFKDKNVKQIFNEYLYNVCDFDCQLQKYRRKYIIIIDCELLPNSYIAVVSIYKAYSF